MGADKYTPEVAANPQARRRVQAGVIGFFSVVALSLVIIYALRPAIYVSVLGAKAPSTASHPLIATIFLVAILLFIAVLVVGVLQCWRWLFWLLMAAFLFSALQLPAGALELAGVLSRMFPAWYTIYRSLVALAEVGLGVWLLVVWRRWGVWAAGRRRRR
jgi:hypothetical protein